MFTMHSHIAKSVFGNSVNILCVCRGKIMTVQDNRVVLITGASSGLGLACAEHLHSKGYRVYGTSRQIKRDTPSGSFQMIRMDVCDDNSVKEAIGRIVAAEKQLDILVNNAGISVSGAVEDISIAEYKIQFETNFFGALRVCQGVLPIMREQRSGCIINVSSLAGQIGLPFDGAYAASKFALEGVSEALRMEVKAFGIKVVLLEPGDINTGMTARNLLSEKSTPVYSENFNRARKSAMVNEKWDLLRRASPGLSKRS